MIREDLRDLCQSVGSRAKFMGTESDERDRVLSYREHLAFEILKAFYQDADTDGEALFQDMRHKSAAYEQTLTPREKQMIANTSIEERIEELKSHIYRQQRSAQREERDDQAFKNLGDVNLPDSDNGARKLMEMQKKYGNTDRTLDVLNKASERPRILESKADEVGEARRIVREDLRDHITYYRRLYTLMMDESEPVDAVDRLHAPIFLMLGQAFDDLVYGRLDYQAAHERLMKQLEEFEAASPPGLVHEARLIAALAELDEKTNWHQKSVEREERIERHFHKVPEPKPVDRRLPEARTRPPFTGEQGGKDQPTERQIKPKRPAGMK